MATEMDSGYRIVKLRNGDIPICMAKSLKEILTHPEQYLAGTKLGDRFNFFYTIARVKASDRKIMESQGWMPFDIDDIGDAEDPSLYIEIFADHFGIKKESFSIVYTGNGIHCLVRIKEPITSPEYFNSYSKYYNSVCAELTSKFKRKGLVGHMDDSVFTKSRLMRMPGTINEKKGVKKPCKFVQYGEEKYDFDWHKLVGALPDSYTTEGARREFGPADTIAVVNGCEFLKHCKTNAATLPEPYWHAMVGTLAYLPDGEALCHEYSRPYPHYSADETDIKIERAKTLTGPRKCESIDQLWGGCTGCPNYGKVITPIAIRGEDYIATERDAFRYADTTSGKVKYKIRAEDILKVVTRDHHYKVIEETDAVCLFSGTKYVKQPEGNVKALINEYLLQPAECLNGRPFAISDPLIINKLAAQIALTNRKSIDEFLQYPIKARCVNMQNGIFEYDLGALRARTVEDLFFGYLDYDYNPDATCPTFINYLNTSIEDPESIQAVLEFIGAGMFHYPSQKLQKFLLLLGEGGNGKSVLLDIIRTLAGTEACTSVMITEDSKKDERDKLKGKKFNLLDEQDHIKNPISAIKSLVTGGMLIGGELYESTTEFKNDAKIILTMNKVLPEFNMGESHMRRMISINMDKIITDKDITLSDKLNAERPGIFNMVYRAYLNFMARGVILEPKISIEEKEDMLETSDRVYAFFKEFVESDINGSVPATELYSIFKGYCEDAGVPYHSQAMFGRLIKKHVRINKEYSIGKKRTTKNHFYTGIKFKEVSNGGISTVPMAETSNSGSDEEPILRATSGNGGGQDQRYDTVASADF